MLAAVDGPSRPSSQQTVHTVHSHPCALPSFRPPLLPLAPAIAAGFTCFSIGHVGVLPLLWSVSVPFSLSVLGSDSSGLDHESMARPKWDPTEAAATLSPIAKATICSRRGHLQAEPSRTYPIRTRRYGRARRRPKPMHVELLHEHGREMGQRKPYAEPCFLSTPAHTTPAMYTGHHPYPIHSRSNPVFGHQGAGCPIVC